jgi:hypothetical protein
LNDFGKESWFFHTKAGVSSTTRSSTGWKPVGNPCHKPAGEGQNFSRLSNALKEPLAQR